MVMFDAKTVSDVLDKFYTDLFTVKRSVKIKNPDGSTGPKSDEVIYEDVRCRISRPNFDNPSLAGDQMNKSTFVLELFYGSDISLKDGDKVELKKRDASGTNVIQTYKGVCGLPIVRETGCEVLVQISEVA